RRPGEPPLDKGLIPWLGHAIEFRRDMYAFLRRMQRKHGDTFTVCLGGEYMTFILDPHDMTAVAREARSTLDFTEFARKLVLSVFGVNLKAEFAKATEALNCEYVHLQGKGLVGLTDAMMHQLNLVIGPGGHRDTKWHESGLFHFCYDIVFRAGYLALYGQDSGGPAVQLMCSLEVFKEFRKYDQLFPAIATSSLWPAQRKEAERLQSWFWKLMDYNNETYFPRKPHLVQKQQGLVCKASQAMTPSISAGTDGFCLPCDQGNTGPAAFWTLAYLMRHADAMAAVRAEVQQLLEATGQSDGAETREISLTRDALVKTPVLDSAIEEMLRLRSAPILVRAVQQDMTLQVPGASGPGTKLRAGDRLAMFPHLSPHMDPEVHADPEEFKFDRFLNEDGSKKTDFFKSGRKLRYPTMPWGAGVSICPGRFFATNEIKQFIVLMLIHYDVELSDPTTKVPDINVSRFGFGVMHPTHEISFRYRPRF
uniref:Cytochrome P450 family 8 subfamily B member 1 n=1 Tax=Petromyzon marinus TaxID=7757 RepID=S4RHP4_PETMA